MPSALARALPLDRHVQDRGPVAGVLLRRGPRPSAVVGAGQVGSAWSRLGLLVGSGVGLGDRFRLLRVRGMPGPGLDGHVDGSADGAACLPARQRTRAPTGWADRPGVAPRRRVLVDQPRAPRARRLPRHGSAARPPAARLPRPAPRRAPSGARARSSAAADHGLVGSSDAFGAALSSVGVFHGVSSEPSPAVAGVCTLLLGVFARAVGSGASSAVFWSGCVSSLSVFSGGAARPGRPVTAAEPLAPAVAAAVACRCRRRPAAATAAGAATAAATPTELVVVRPGAGSTGWSWTTRPRPLQCSQSAAEGLEQPGADALARHLHQAERGDLGDLVPGAVAAEALHQPAQHQVAVGLQHHVDEVDDDDAADVAQPELAHDLLGCLEVVLGDRLLEVAAGAGELAGVHVDDGHRLGAVDDQRAAGGQPDLAVQALGDLLVDAVGREEVLPSSSPARSARGGPAGRGRRPRRSRRRGPGVAPGRPAGRSPR